MSDSEEEYEVESIAAAKVEAVSKGRRSKLIWKYRVRWKGYPPDQDTWEPVDNFVSKEMVPAFWERVNTGGRDWNDIGLFKVGEEFCRVGPPRGKKRKSLNADVPDEDEKPVASTRHAGSSKRAEEPEPTPKSEKRKRGTQHSLPTPERPAKRTRETRRSIATEPVQPSTSGLSTRSKANALSAGKPTKEETPHQSSPEIVSDSEEEVQVLQLPPDYVSPTKSGKKKAAEPSPPPAEEAGPSVIDVDAIDDAPTPSELAQMFSDNTPIGALPTHRGRLANPRVKMVDEAELGTIDSTVAFNVRAVDQQAADASSSNANPSPKKKKRSKPGPGRSSAGHISLLTADNVGGLQTIKVKTKRSAMPSPSPTPIPSEDILMEPKEALPPPTSEELLQLAGLDADEADALSDFEDPNIENAATTDARPHTIDEHSSRGESLDKAKNSLFPFQSPPSPSTLPSSWTSSTIFGPLSLGASALPDNTSSVDGPQLLLSLDSSVSLPTTISQSHPTADLFAQKPEHGSVPGKFYAGDAASSILSAIRATGESAILVLAQDASDDNKRDFTLLHKRLKAGDIFATASGMSTLVLTSSSSPLSPRLNIPAALLHRQDQVVASRVSIENFNGYASAAASADSRRWAQYVIDEQAVDQHPL